MIINILAIISITFCIQNISGPFGVLSIIKNKLMTNSYVGVFFYELFECPYCLGFHSGYIVYFLSTESFKFTHFILWALAGAFISYISNLLVGKLNANI